jgi:hypothetical protein
MGFDIGIALAERRAREILDDLGLDRIAGVDIRDLAFERGLLVEARRIRGAEGRLIRRGERAIAVIDVAIREQGKRRFVAAHELGHFELHRDEPVFVCTQADFLDWHRRRPAETEANRFAAELLLPKAVFVEDARQLGVSFDAIRSLTETYATSLTATAFRYVHLDVAPSALVCCVDGQIEWSLVSSTFPYKRIRRGCHAHPHSGAGEFFARRTTSNRPEATPLTAWFLDDTVDSAGRCYEQCCPMPTYNSTLSLIWEV